MTILLAPVTLDLTTLSLLAPRSDHLSYRALFEEDDKSSQLRGWKRQEIKDSVAEWKISHIIYSDFIDHENKCVYTEKE